MYEPGLYFSSEWIPWIVDVLQTLFLGIIGWYLLWRNK